MYNFNDKHKAHRKWYYADILEMPRTIEYCYKFVERYIKHEQRIFRWIQTTK